MKERKKQRRMKEERKERVTFLQWYEKHKKPKVTWVDIILLCVCFSGAYFTCMYYIGNGAYNYTEEAYDNLKKAIEGNVTEFGPDSIALAQEVKNYDISFNNGKIILECREQRGHFVAEVSAELSATELSELKPYEAEISNSDSSEKEQDNEIDSSEMETKAYYEIPTTRNYNSREDYLVAHYLEVCLKMIGLAVSTWLIIFKFLWHSIIFLIAQIKKHSKVKETSDNTFDVQETC